MGKDIATRVSCSAINVLVNAKHFHREAILLFLESAKDHQKTAEFTVRVCLRRYEKSVPHFCRDHGALSLALDVAGAFPPSQPLDEKTVLTAARAGYIGRFPELPQKLLGRSPNETEVVALVSAYVNNKGSRCTGTEEKLKGFAQKYLNTKAAEVEIKRLRQFGVEWDRAIDL